ncbi:MAG: MBL fold metallo-hydrolase [Cocleimonas sp.]
MDTIKFKNLGNGITLVDAEYGQQSGVASIYLLVENGEVAIIETGTNHSVPFVKEALEAQNLNFENVRYIIPTHVHLDHAGGAGELMHLCPNAELVVHPFGARHLIDPSKLEAGTIAVYGEKKFRKLYGTIRPIEASRVIEAPGFFKLKLSDRKLRFFDTPGHARHHFCIYDKQSNGIFTGDTFGVSYPQITTKQGRFIFATTTPVQFDPGSLLQSIDCLTSLKPDTMYLTHFGSITPTPEIIKQLRQSIRTFANIALEEQQTTENRIEIIQHKLKNYLLDLLREMGCEQSREFCEEVIEFDTLLNAKGLDFWLSKSA